MYVSRMYLPNGESLAPGRTERRGAGSSKRRFATFSRAFISPTRHSVNFFFCSSFGFLVSCQESYSPSETAAATTTKTTTQKKSAKKNVIFITCRNLFFSTHLPTRRSKGEKNLGYRIETAALIPRHDLNVSILRLWSDLRLVFFFSFAFLHVLSGVLLLGGVRISPLSFLVVVFCFFSFLGLPSNSSSRCFFLCVCSSSCSLSTQPNLFSPWFSWPSSSRGVREKRKDDWSLSVAQARSYNSVCAKAYGTTRVITIVINGRKESPFGVLAPFVVLPEIYLHRERASQIG